MSQALSHLTSAFVHVEDAARECALAEEVGLVEACRELSARLHAAMELAERTSTLPSGARIVTRGKAGGRTPSGGCLR